MPSTFRMIEMVMMTRKLTARNSAMRFNMGGKNSLDPASRCSGGHDRAIRVREARAGARDRRRAPRARAAQALEELRPLPGVLSITVGFPADADCGEGVGPLRERALREPGRTRPPTAPTRSTGASWTRSIAPRSAARKGWTFSIETV